MTKNQTTFKVQESTTESNVYLITDLGVWHSSLKNNFTTQNLLQSLFVFSSPEIFNPVDYLVYNLIYEFIVFIYYFI